MQHRSRIFFSIIGLFIFAIVAGVAAAPPTWTGGTLGGDGGFPGDFVEPGDENVLLGHITINLPAEDTIIRNGASYVIAEGDSLTVMDDNLRFIDRITENQAYDDGEGVFLSTDNVLDSTDTVITAIALHAFPEVPVVSTGNTAIGWVDNGTVNGVLDANEAMFRIIQNAAALTDGAIGRVANGYFGIGISAGDGGEGTVAIVEDVDVSNTPSAGDVVVTGSTDSTLTLFDIGDGVCFDGSIVDDAEYDVGEVIWWSAAGDCSAFVEANDVILVGAALPTGTLTSFGVEGEVAYLDSNANGIYDCGVGGCEVPMYSGVDGTNFTSGTIPVGASFLDASTLARGVHTLFGPSFGSDAIDGVMSSMSATNEGQILYLYADLNSNNDYDDGETIVRVFYDGGTDIATGQALRLFHDNNYYTDAQADADFPYIQGITGGGVANALILSTNNAFLDPGLLDGSGTDTVVRASGVNAPNKYVFNEVALLNYTYHDHDASGAYADGDDIINDIDDSGYYRADDFLSAVFDAGDTAVNMEDTDLDAVYIYERVGDACVGSGTDTLIGSKVAAPFLNQTIAITKDIFTRSSTVNERTFCVYADLANDAVEGTALVPQFSSATFSSGESLAANFTAEGDTQFITVFANVTVTPVDATPGETTNYTLRFTPAVTVPVGGRIFWIPPAGFDITGASISCSNAGGNLGGDTALMFGALILDGTTSAMTGGSQVTCTLADIGNHETEDTYTIQGFYVSTEDTYFYQNTTATVTIANAPPDGGGGGGGGGGRIEEIPEYTVVVTNPTSGQIFTKGQTITTKWNDTSTEQIGYVNVYVSTDAENTSWTKIGDRVANIGSYSFTLPAVDTSTARVRVALSDLVGEFTSANSAQFQIGTGTPPVEEGPVMPPPTEEEVEEILEGIKPGDYVRAIGYPAVFYVGHDAKRHVFTSEATYFTWQTSFNAVRAYPASILERIPEGQSMLPKAGTILVKMPESPKVYYVGLGSSTSDLKFELTWIPSEAEATRLFGSDWNQKIIDLEFGTFGIFVNNGSETTDSNFMLLDEIVLRRDQLRIR